MGQLFRDLCHEAYTDDGFLGLAHLWIRALPDLAASLTASYVEAIEEVLMNLNRTVIPVPWEKVALVILPGLLFGISRVVYPLGWPAGISFLLVAMLAMGVFVLQRRLPIWGLLALGSLTSWVLQRTSTLLPKELTRSLLRIDHPATVELGKRLLFSFSLQQMMIAVPVWLVIIWLLWKYRQVWRSSSWVILLSGLAIVGASILSGANVLLYTGLVLLPLALGLPLSRQYGSLASLFVLGVFSYLVLSDSDYYSAYMMDTQPFYPLYAIPLVWMLVSLAPLLLLRAQTLRSRATGLLAPTLVWGTARIAVPLLFRPGFHPLSIWLGEALFSAFVVFLLALTFYLYSQLGDPIRPSKDVRASQMIYNG